MKNSTLRRFVAVASLVLGVPSFAQTLSWSSPQSSAFFTDVGGTSGRNSVGAAAFQGGLWIAYTSTANCSGDCPIVVANNGGAGASTAFNGGTTVPTSFFFTGYAVSSDNPALLSGNVINVGPTLFLAFRTSSGGEYIARTTNGSSWDVFSLGSIGTSPSGPVYSPSMALSSDGSTLYIGYMDAATYNPILCSLNAANPSSPSCQTLTGLRPMFFNPGLSFFQNQLYMGFEDRGGSHCLYFDRGDPTTNSFSVWNPNNSCPEQTSAAPSLVTHNGYLYSAFRTNDSSQKFTVRVTTNGSDFGYRQQPGWSIDGPPGLVDLNQFGVNGVFAVFSRSNTLYTSIGQ